MPATSGAPRHRLPWDAIVRCIAGGPGGYVLAHLLPVALVAPWGLPPSDAVLVAMMLGLVVHVLAFMGAFAARSAGHACALIALWILASAVAAWAAL